MFGIVSFSAAAFSSVGENYFDDSIAETITLTDGLADNASQFIDYAETVTLADVVTSNAVQYISLGDTVSPTDSLSVANVLNTSLAESITLSDVITSNANYQGITVAESISLFDNFIRRLLWEPIADTQVANWTQIADTQSTTWTQIADTQSANWTLINTE